MTSGLVACPHADTSTAETIIQHGNNCKREVEEEARGKYVFHAVFCECWRKRKKHWLLEKCFSIWRQIVFFSFEPDIGLSFLGWRGRMFGVLWPMLGKCLCWSWLVKVSPTVTISNLLSHKTKFGLRRCKMEVLDGCADAIGASSPSSHDLCKKNPRLWV